MVQGEFLSWDICVAGANKHSLGLDQFDMSTFSQYLKLWYTYQITYVCLHFFIKTSILFFLYALSRSKPYRIGIYILGTLITLYTISMVFVSIFECNPIHHAWDPLKFGTDCIYLPTLYYTQASFNLATDVALLAYPLPTLIALRLPTPKKLMLIGIFSVGSLTILASILRFFAIRDLSNPANDTNIASGLILVWSEVEANIGMIAASAPALQPLVKRALVGNVRGEGYPGTTREGMSRDSTTFFSGAPRSRDTIDSSAPGSSSEPKPPLSSMPLSRLSAALRGSTTSFPGKVETTISSDAPPLPSPGFTPHTPPGPYGFGSGGSAGYGTSEEEVGWERGIMKSTRVVVSYDDDEEKGGLSARRV